MSMHVTALRVWVGETSRWPRPRARAFSLVEILIVVAILGILAALIVPKYSNISSTTAETALAEQLGIVRGQIEVYCAQHNADPALLLSQWTDLIAGGYLRSEPVNPLNHCTLIAPAAGAGAGWVWRDKGAGKFGLFATDAAFAEFVP